MVVPSQLRSTRKTENALSYVGSLLLFVAPLVILSGVISLALVEHANQGFALVISNYYLAGFAAVPLAILLSCTPLLTRCFSQHAAPSTPHSNQVLRARTFRLTVMIAATAFALINAWQYAP